MKIALRSLVALAAIAAAASVAFAQSPTVPPATAAKSPPAAPASPSSVSSSPSTAPAATPAAKPAAAEAPKSGNAMEGLATVYSSKLNGRKTASGQVFRQSALTAAHPSLAFGTHVKVTHTKNEKSVVVRINDRGPTQAGRVIDLSSAAAAKIGIGKNGMAPVRLDVVGDAPAKNP